MPENFYGRDWFSFKEHYDEVEKKPFTCFGSDLVSGKAYQPIQKQQEQVKISEEEELIELAHSLDNYCYKAQNSHSKIEIMNCLNRAIALSESVKSKLFQLISLRYSQKQAVSAPVNEAFRILNILMSAVASEKSAYEQQSEMAGGNDMGTGYRVGMLASSRNRQLLALNSLSGLCYSFLSNQTTEDYEHWLKTIANRITIAPDLMFVLNQQRTQMAETKKAEYAMRQVLANVKHAELSNRMHEYNLNRNTQQQVIQEEGVTGSPEHSWGDVGSSDEQQETIVPVSSVTVEQQNKQEETEANEEFEAETKISKKEEKKKARKSLMADNFKEYARLLLDSGVDSPENAKDGKDIAKIIGLAPSRFSEIQKEMMEDRLITSMKGKHARQKLWWGIRRD
jgi:hypothetical protein